MAGTRAHDASDASAPFSLLTLAHHIGELVGEGGVVCFAIGLYAAGISSALTVPLALVTAFDEMFALAPPSAGAAERAEAPLETHADECTNGSTAAPAAPAAPARAAGWYGRGGRAAIMATVVLVSLIPTLFGAPTMTVVLTAQVTAGLVLPGFTASLLLCLNERALVGARVQPPLALAATSVSVAVTFYLASVTVLDRAVLAPFGAKIEAAAAAALVPTALGMVVLGVLVHRGRGARGAAPGSHSRPLDGAVHEN